jgi:hypothetical protein
MTGRRFPPLWHVVEMAGCFTIRDTYLTAACRRVGSGLRRNLFWLSDQQWKRIVSRSGR